jgi:hypothetical protein
MLQFYGQAPSPKIIWIDNGASSQRLLEVLDGEFIDLTLESGISINLFDLEEGEELLTPARIKLVLVVLPFVPVITITPSGSCANDSAKNRGNSRSTTKPGKAAPRRPSRCKILKTILPVKSAMIRIM